MTDERCIICGETEGGGDHLVGGQPHTFTLIDSCFVVRVDDPYDSSIFGIYSTLDAAKAHVEKEVAENSNCASKDWKWLAEDDGRKHVYVDQAGDVFSSGRIDRYPLNKPAF
jgi:hypothetical protein